MGKCIPAQQKLHTSLIQSWFQDVGTDAALYEYSTRRKLSLSLGRYIVAFQSDM
jgi:hypothetical protein